MTASHSPDLSEDIKQQLQTIIPAAFKDGQLDVEVLHRLLGTAAPARDERYGLNWAGKADSYKALQYPSSATLRPQINQSVDFEHAQHVFIEGENLEVLKVLQRAYFGKVKMIYIDPPYNTGGDSFIYPDRFQESREDYLKRIDSLDIDGNLTKEGLFHKNSKDNGHYHSNWLSMMLPRLYLARNLLRDDGVIFISIDDNEVANLKMLCDEVFGGGNFLGQFTRLTKKGGKATDVISKNNDLVFCYSKNSNPKLYPFEHNDKDFKHSDEHFDTRGFFKLNQTLDYDTLGYVNSLDYEIVINGESYYPGSVSKEEFLIRKNENPKDGYRCRWSAALFKFGYENGFIVVKKSKNGTRIYSKTYQLATIEDDGDYYISYEDRTKALSSVEFIDNIYSNDNAKKDVTKLLGKGMFDYPKPCSLVTKLTKFSTKDNDLILDFFAGSATIAQAVMELNIEDGGNRKFICVQMPEPCDVNSEAFKAGYATIADISRERIRRVIKRIRQNADLASPVAEHDPNLGFRSFQLAPNNFKQWRGNWAETAEELDKQLGLMLPTEKIGATAFDMAFELLLKNGRPLISHVETQTISETPVYLVWAQDIDEAEPAFMFLLERMNLEALPELLAMKPKQMVFLDSVFTGNDSTKVNVSLQYETAGVKFSSI